MIQFRSRVGPIQFTKQLGWVALVVVLNVLVAIFVIIPCVIGATL
jgi:hypothetical protein